MEIVHKNILKVYEILIIKCSQDNEVMGEPF